MSFQYLHWQLDNMFDALTPTDEKQRSKAFVGRESELEQILGALSRRDRAILVYGYYGIGKTMLMRESLARIKMLDPHFITAYTTFIPDIGFKKCVLIAVAEQLTALKIQGAEDVLYSLTRGSVSNTERISGQIGGQIGIGSTHVGGHKENQQEKTSSTGEVNIDYELRSLREKVPNERIVIAIDDIERKADIASIQDIIDDIKTLRNYGYSLIVPGHPVNATSALQDSAGGALLSVELKQLGVKQLLAVIYSHLELGRGVSRQDHFPFTTPAAEMIAQKFSGVDNTVRELVVACYYILEEAAGFCSNGITPEDLEKIFPKIGSRILDAVDNRELALRALKTIKANGGIISEDSDYEVIRHVLNRSGGYEDTVVELKELFEKSLLLEDNDGTKMSMKINPNLLSDNVLDAVFSEID